MEKSTVLKVIIIHSSSVIAEIEGVQKDMFYYGWDFKRLTHNRIELYLPNDELYILWPLLEAYCTQEFSIRIQPA